MGNLPTAILAQLQMPSLGTNFDNDDDDDDDDDEDGGGGDGGGDDDDAGVDHGDDDGDALIRWQSGEEGTDI